MLHLIVYENQYTELKYELNHLWLKRGEKSATSSIVP